MKHLFPLLFLAWSCAEAPAASTPEAIERQILSLMQAQQDAWNAGNLEGFMESYWKSDSLIFIGRNGVTRGWEATLKRYQKSYPTAEDMGQLEFESLHLETDGTMAWQVGTWTLFRTQDTLSGHFTVQWHLKNGRWVMVADHSS